MILFEPGDYNLACNIDYLDRNANKLPPEHGNEDKDKGVVILASTKNVDEVWT
ncbi:hypothetical protein [Thalassotalea sp. ND16A]|uniref:hypothetical protein n=1 Tax=Thalassotalea sp. ND16A TaxID=1535422 RepID=UPI0013628B23|nr:hypothetical protein [Thalassotalea sp. ND16A]